MEANELMIGDWIEFTSKYGYGTGRIAAIEPREGSVEPTTFSVIKYKKDGTLFYVGVSKTCVRPIPLTPEILDKNGLKHDTAEDAYAFRYIKDDISVLECYANAGSRYRCIIAYGETRLRKTICFVHELQHAIRLCGIEKEIEL